MFPRDFKLYIASTLEEALELKRRGAVPLAGGQSLIPSMKLRIVSPEEVVYLGKLPLRYIRDGGDHIVVGALSTHSDVAKSPLTSRYVPLLAMAAVEIGDVQVRNMGTVGGSLAHADPAADYPAALLALGGHISVRGLTSTRVVPVEEFFKGPYTTALGEDELVVEVSVPKRRGHAAYVKYARTAADFGIASVAVLLDVEGGVVKEARIGVSGVSLKPFRAKAIEEALAGRKPEEAALRRAVEVDPEVEPLSDARADANTRVKLFRAVAYRALREALAKAGVKAGP